TISPIPFQPRSSPDQEFCSSRRFYIWHLRVSQEAYQFRSVISKDCASSIGRGISSQVPFHQAWEIVLFSQP
ncbi:unnamed protein product, partial [Sphagnum compactum]